MDPATVAAFYQAKGYTVREGVRMPGLSGNEHKVPLLAEGPLGSLAVFFGDFGGVDGPEMGGARKAARDIGATPVLAADEFSNHDRQVAARLGVVLLDGSMMTEDHPAPAQPAAATAAAWPGLAGLQVRDPKAAPKEADQHPWPASGRVGGHDGPAVAPIDIDDLLADTRRPRASATRPVTAEAVLDEAAAATTVVGPGEEEAQEQDGESLWRKPRAATATANATPALARGRADRFAWLQGDAGAATGGRRAGKAGGASGDSGGFAIDYDDVVPSRGPKRPAPDGPAPDDDGTGDGGGERLGDDADMQPAMDQVARKERRDRLMRRIFWLLFAFVFVYLFYLFWTNQLGN